MLLLAAGNERKRKQEKQRKSEGGRCNNCHKHLCWVWIVLPNEEGRSNRGLTSQELRQQAEEDDEVKDEIGKLITAQVGINNFGCLSDRCCCKCGKYRAQVEDEQARARTGVLVGGAMMTRRGVGRGRPVLGAMVIANSVQKVERSRKRAEERRRILIAPYKRGKINPRDFCIPIDVPGAVSIYADKKEKKEVIVTTTTTMPIQTVLPVMTVVQPVQPIFAQQPPQDIRYTTVIGVPYSQPMQETNPFQVYNPQQVQYVQPGQYVQQPAQYVQQQSMPQPVQCVQQPGQLPVQYVQQPMQQGQPQQVQYVQQPMQPIQGQSMPQQVQYVQPMQGQPQVQYLQTGQQPVQYVQQPMQQGQPQQVQYVQQPMQPIQGQSSPYQSPQNQPQVVYLQSPTQQPIQAGIATNQVLQGQ